MTARKPKPRKPALRNELEALQTRKRFRDASHDAPVSNANETVCASGTLVAPLTPPAQSWWRRFLDHMGSA